MEDREGWGTAGSRSWLGLEWGTSARSVALDREPEGNLSQALRASWPSQIAPMAWPCFLTPSAWQEPLPPTGIAERRSG